MHGSLIALSAAYGAGGGHVGRAVARALDVPFLDRAIPAGVARRLAVPLREAEARDAVGPGLLDRLLAGVASIGLVAAAETVPPDAAFRRATEEIIRGQAASGSGVILGRGAVWVLAEHPRVTRVRLDGPPEAREAQATALLGVDPERARFERRETDHARETYVRHLYGAEVTDPAHFDLVLDSTSMALDECVKIVLAAARARDEWQASLVKRLWA